MSLSRGYPLMGMLAANCASKSASLRIRVQTEVVPRFPTWRRGGTYDNFSDFARRGVSFSANGSSLKSKQDEARKPTPISEFTSKVSNVINQLNIARSRFSSIYDRVADTSYGRLMRLDKPIGHNLLFLPGAWGITAASSTTADFLTLTTLFYGGAVLMRGAGCTINDIFDADIDKRVKRTMSRPIAAGEISSTSAFIFLGAQLSGALWVLTKLNTATFLVGTLSVLPVLYYPFAKRVTAYPQAFLGLTFNWGALMGYTAAKGTIGLPAILLYGAGWCWTMVYDTIYAHQDKEDDKILGVGTTALALGQDTKPILVGLTAAKLAFLTGAGLAADLSLPYFMGITASTIHLGNQIYTTDLSDPEQCQRAFVSNQVTGAITWAALVAGRLF